MITLYKWFCRGVVFYFLPLVLGFFVCASLARAYDINVDLTTPQGACTASYVFSGYEPDKAIDNDSLTYWLAAYDAFGWWKYDFGTDNGNPIECPIDKVVITKGTGGSDGTFEVLGSNDDVSYDSLFSGTIVATSELETFTFVNSVSYRFVKLVMFVSSGSRDIKEIELMVTTLSPTPTPTPVASVIFGKVADFYRTPLEGVEVMVNKGTETVGVVESDMDGYFVVRSSGVEESDILDFSFVKPKFITVNTSVIVGAVSVVECPDMFLQRGTGTEYALTVIVMSDGELVPGAKVRFKRAGFYPFVSYTNGSGTCIINRLRDKLYGYVVTCDGFVKLRGTKQVTVSEDLPLELVAE